MISNAFANRKILLDCSSPLEIVGVIFARGPQTLVSGQAMAVCRAHCQTESAAEMSG